MQRVDGVGGIQDAGGGVGGFDPLLPIPSPLF